MTFPAVAAARKAQSPDSEGRTGETEAVGGGAVIGAMTVAAGVEVGNGVGDAGTSVGTIRIGGRIARAVAVCVGAAVGGRVAATAAGAGRAVAVRGGSGVGRAVAVAVAEGEGEGIGTAGEVEAVGEGTEVGMAAGTAVAGGGWTGLVGGGVGVGAGAETSGTRVTSLAVAVLGPHAEAAGVAAAMKETQALESARITGDSPSLAGGRILTRIIRERLQPSRGSFSANRRQPSSAMRPGIAVVGLPCLTEKSLAGTRWTRARSCPSFD